MHILCKIMYKYSFLKIFKNILTNRNDRAIIKAQKRKGKDVLKMTLKETFKNPEKIKGRVFLVSDDEKFVLKNRFPELFIFFDFLGLIFCFSKRKIKSVKIKGTRFTIYF